jgi:hypothetical protein
MKIDNNLKWIKIEDTAYKVGIKLGETGKEAVWEHLLKSTLWKKVTSYSNKKVIATLHKNTKEKFPLIYEEIKGLSKGLELPFEDVFLWNCRGDILANTNDGCTTLQLPSETNCIAHNEDGFPFFLKKCFISEISIANNPQFISFCYPGSIPGHTFGVNKKGVVKTVNNIRLKNVEPKIPRMVLTRAILNSNSLESAIDLIKKNSKSGGFNLSLASCKDKRLFDVEFGNGVVSVNEIKEISLHSNHSIYSPLNHKSQIITDSSKDRQQRFFSIKKTHKKITPMDILRDKNGEGLPIFRTDINDPDNENTIASAIFKVSKNKIEYTFYESDSPTPSYEGTI